MRNRSRLLLLLAPWSAALPRAARAQPNPNVPSGGAGEEQGEVQVGAGTQGDVTTGTSGTKAGKKTEAGGAAKKAASPGAASKANESKAAARSSREARK